MKTERPLKPTDSAIRAYYAELEAYGRQGVLHEGAVSSAFEKLLAECARRRGWVLIPQLAAPGDRRNVPDGTLRDENSLPRGYWEAKDSDDDLKAEIAKKIARGYPVTNTIFEDTRHAVLYQNKQPAPDVDLHRPAELAFLLNQFFTYRAPNIAEFEQAVDEFKEHVPDLARGLNEKIKEAHRNNRPFIAAFDAFFKLCQTALNPNIRPEAVDEMIIQHLLTERLIGSIFDKPEFVQQNVIAAEVEKVVTALARQSFSRKDYLKSLDRFYLAIESAARTLPDFSDKQHFLNTVYERFFQGYSVKVADTHGIVYTPQPIVDFMCASVAEVLEKEFGKSLASEDVYIIDPCTGTGNFIVNLLRRMPRRDLPRMYRQQMFANEVMLLPYYIAALNIEHAFYEMTGGYEPFEGLCFVDTLDLAEGTQSRLGFMTEANTQRVERQRRTPITVIVGNPPYNSNQLNENDNNKNRKYPVVDRRIHETYAKDSKGTLRNKLYDPYVRFFRWAADRLGDRDGIVCLVTNNNFFVDRYPFDGFRKHLQADFSSLYHVDLNGNVRRNPKLSGTVHNVFGIRPGVGITIGVRHGDRRAQAVRYSRLPETWRKEEKLAWLANTRDLRAVKWDIAEPDECWCWVQPDNADEFADFVCLGSKGLSSKHRGETIFQGGAPGVKTNRDDVVYAFDRETLRSRVVTLVEAYNSEVDRLKRSPKPKNIDDFWNYEKLKWSSGLKLNAQRGDYAEFREKRIRMAFYRPFTKMLLYYDRVLDDRPSWYERVLPDAASEKANRLLCCTNHSQMPFVLQVTNCIPNEAVGGRAGNCFPYYIYDEDGSNRRENITDWALEQFRKQYKDETITKWDIFYYVYGVLHHPVYREKFAENLKRELPRIPLIDAVIPTSEARRNLALKSQSEIPRSARDDKAGGLADTNGADGANGVGAGPKQNEEAGSNETSAAFWAVSRIGKGLADLHINYQALEPYPLKWLENRSVPLSYRVEDKMRLSKDKRSVKVNESLTLAGIPPETFEYRLGNRSALEWVIDQYQVTERNGIRSDPNRGGPNREDDPEYIVRLVGQVVRVSLETVRLTGLIAAYPLP